MQSPARAGCSSRPGCHGHPHAAVCTDVTMAARAAVHVLACLVAAAAAAAVPGLPAAAPPPPGGNHLWFRSFLDGGFFFGESGGLACGEVDAGPRIPDGLFQSRGQQGGPFELYVDLTVDLYRVNVGGQEIRVERGRCADKKYIVPLPSPDIGKNVSWAPEGLMDEVCQTKCQCNFENKNKTVPQLPKCIDANYAGPYCSLCGPKYNKPIDIAMFACHCPKHVCKCPGPEARPPAPTPKGSVGLVPFPNCTKPGGKVCYQGMAEDLAQVVKLDPFACQPPHEARLVPYQWFDTDPCYDSGFGIPLVSAGHPVAPPVAQFRHHCLSHQMECLSTTMYLTLR